MKRSMVPAVHVVSLLVSLVLAACGATPTPLPEPSPTAQPTQQPSGAIVVDAMGRTVEFAQPPQRIVLAGKSTLTLVNALYLFPEAKDRVVGVVAGKQKPGLFLGLIDPTFDQKPMLEVEAGPEQIAPLKPDVVVLRSSMADKLGKPLEAVGIPVVYLDLETPEQYFRDLKTLGQLLGNPARAQEIEAYYQSRTTLVSKGLQDLAEQDKPRVLLVQYSEQGGEVALNVPPAPWIQTTEVEMAGGLPVWKETAQGGGWMVVNLEQIAAWDPDRIVVISYGADSREVAAKLKADANWQGLKAVQTGEVVGFAGDIYSWDQPDPRWILGVTWLAKTLHPDRFEDLDMQAAIAQFFSQMYGMDPATVQAKIVPLLKGEIK